MRRIYFNLVKLEEEIYFIEILWILITFRKVGSGLLTKKEKKYGYTTVINLLQKYYIWRLQITQIFVIYCIPRTTIIQFPHGIMQCHLHLVYLIILLHIIIIFFFHIKDSILFLADPSRENKCMLILHAYFKQGASNHNLNMKHSIWY